MTVTAFLCMEDLSDKSGKESSINYVRILGGGRHFPNTFPIRIAYKKKEEEWGGGGGVNMRR